MMQTLPRLDGRLGVVVRAAYYGLALLTIVIVAGGLIFNGLDFFRNGPAGTRWGLRTLSPVEVGGAPYIGWASPIAVAQGLHKGDRFVAIQGKALPREASEFGIGKRLASIEGEQIALTMRHGDGRIATMVLPRSRTVWTERDFVSGLPLWLSASAVFFGIELIPLFLLGASLVLFKRRPNDPEAMLFAFGFLLLCNLPVADFWLLAILYLPVSVPVTLLAMGQFLVIVAAAGFPEGRFDSVWSRAVLVAALPLAILNTAVHHLAGNSMASGLISGVVLLLLGALAFIGLSYRYNRLESGAARQQIKWAVLGFFVSAVATAAYISLLNFDAVSRSPVQFLGFQLLQVVAFLALPAGLIVSLLRYRLYDAEATISRSAAYLLLTASLVILFAATEKVIELLGSTILGGSVGAVAGGVAAGVAAVMIAPMHHRFNRWAKHRFQFDLVRLREGLPMLVGDLREVASVDQLARAALARLDEGLHASRLALTIGDVVLATRSIDPAAVSQWRVAIDAAPSDWLRIDRADPLFPLRIPLLIEEATSVGHLLLGPRPDGSFYGSDELETLDEIADPIARAIKICEQREASKAGIAEQMRALFSKIENIEQALRKHSLI